jgi:hypothetical protein
MPLSTTCLLLLLLLLLPAVVVMATTALAAPPPPPSPDPLEKEYSALLNATCARVVGAVPALPASAATSFMQAYQAFNGTGSEAGVVALAQALLSDPQLQAFLTLPDSFSPNGLDADMVLCAVLVDATPLGLAQYAVQGQTQQQLVGQLLNDTLLMRDMLVAGGPANNAYGPAMEIYTALQNASAVLARLRPSNASPGSPWDSRNQSTILARMALGTALGHAVPIAHRYNGANPTTTYVDPVQRYLHYEQAYLAGDLDPATEVLTVFECRWTTDSDAQNEVAQRGGGSGR